MPITGTVADFSGTPSGTASYVPTFAPSHGTATVNADGTYNYTPNTGYQGLDKFGYKISNGLGNTATGYVTIYIASAAVPGNNEPAATGIPDQVNLDADAAISVSVAGSFSDPDSDTLTFVADGLPPGLSMDANGNITGTIDHAASQGGDFLDGVYQVTVYADDGKGGVAMQTFEWKVTNPVPVANPDTVDTSYVTPVIVDLLANDSDPDGDILSVVSATVPAGQGTVAFNGTDWVFTPAAGFTGTATISYTITDAEGAQAMSTHDVVIGPGAINDTYGTPHETAVNGDVKSGDFYLPASVFTKTSDPANGTVVYNADGTYTYTPNAGFTGVDTFNYLVTDPNGQTATATETLHVGPKAVNDGYTTPYITTVNGDVKGADIYLPGSTFTKTSDPANGTVVYNADGTYAYTPNTGFTGIDTFNYLVTDPNGQTATATETITIGPGAINDTYGTPHETAVNGDVKTSDVYRPGSVFTKTSDPANGTVVYNADGTYTYTPNAGFTGSDTFTYLVTAPNGQTATATETIYVGPKAVNDGYTTPYITTVNGDVKGADIYLPGSTFTKTSDPANGTVVYNTDGTYAYTPNAGFTGIETFNYLVTDPNGQTATATETITIGPGAINDTYGTPHETAVNGDVKSGDFYLPASVFTKTSDPANGTVVYNADGTYTYTPNAGFTGVDTFNYLVTDPNGQTATATETITVGAQAVDDIYRTPFETAVNGDVKTSDIYTVGSVFTKTSDPANGTVVYNADGTFTYTPNAGFTGTDTFTYMVTAPDGQTSSATETIHVGPDAADDGYTTAYVTGVIGNAAVGDTYLPGSTFTKATNPANGTVTMNANGTYTYTPNAGFTGIDTFTYTITDPNGQTATAAETITVGPGAVNDAYTTPFQTAVNGDVKASDVYLPGSVFTKTSDPANGTLVYNADGTFTYTPNAGFTGTDTFTYLVTAPSGQTSTATETITVSPPLLIAVSDKYTTAYNTPLNGNAAAGDTFFAGSTFQVVTPPAKGTVTMTPDGLYIFKPAAGFAGTVTFTYRVTDPTGASKIATETIIVRPPLVAAVNHTYLAPIDKPFTGNASLGNKYPTGSVFSIGTKPAHGTVTMRPDGTFVYKPYKGFRAVDTFTYKIKDPTGRIVTATETIRISPRTIIAQCLTTFGNLTGLIRPR